MHREDAANEEETARQMTFLWCEFMITQHQLEEWQGWYEENAPEEQEEIEVAMWKREAEAAEANAAKAPRPLPPPTPAPPVVPIAPPAGAAAPAPITPAALQNAPLNTRVLPPRNLPFVHFDPRVLAEQRVQLEAQEHRNRGKKKSKRNRRKN